MIEYLPYAGIWYLIGLPLATIMFARSKGIIKMGDIPTMLIMALGGPICLVIILFDILNNFFEKRKDVVLWRSHRKKVEHTLYGDKDEKEKGSTSYPYL